MNDFPVRSLQQLPIMLKSLRRTAGMTQASVALRMGITVQALARLERKAEGLSAPGLIKLLGIYQTDLVLRTYGDDERGDLTADQALDW
ncbi:MAG: helix-turn-helix transcriptional regulator [Hydrogenophaga sp.]|nr:helix-turn-helix transcriptional regulator [Hydrogenophaga sp.]